MKRSAIIIGASSGIGLELARLLAGRDYRIAIAARREPQVARIADDAVQKPVDEAMG